MILEKAAEDAEKYELLFDDQIEYVKVMSKQERGGVVCMWCSNRCE